MLQRHWLYALGAWICRLLHARGNLNHSLYNPLIAMGFRLRRSARLGPLRFNFSSGGLSSISVGGRGASFNIPVNRRGGPRTTVGLPGTDLSWSVEHTLDRPAALPAGPA
jgi:hypothetical protein